MALRHLYNTDCRNATELHNEYFPEIGLSTVKRALREEGLAAHHKASVPFISKRNIGIRKKWAEEHENWSQENWNAVAFSDESIFHVFGSDGLEWCWRRPGEQLDPRFTKKKLKHGGGKVVVWGMITRFGVGRIVRIEGMLVKELYVEILQDDVLGSFRDLGLNYRHFYFQQDNDPKHTAKLVKAWFEKHHVDLLPWPPNSPDINIMENVWDYLAHRIRARRPLPKSEMDLWIALQEEWYKIDLDYISHLYDSLPSRIAAVELAKGGNTRY
jgi:transposase